MAVPLMGQQPKLLTDGSTIQLQLVEDGKDGKKVKVRGEFARADLATENGRVYPRAIWERESKRLAKALSERKVLGELDHPGSGKTELSRVSHILTSLELNADGILIGEAEVVDTAKGKDLQALLKSSARIGVSSRGFGSTKPDTAGKEIVQEDYRLGTFDFVADPADSTAYPDPFFESKETRMNPEAQVKLDEEIEARIQAGVASRLAEQARETEARLQAEWAEKLPQLLGKLKAEVQDDVRGELLTDPSVGGARAALESVKAILRPYLVPEDVEKVLQAKDAEIRKLQARLSDGSLKLKGLEEEMARLAAVAKEAGYRFFLEQRLAGSPDAELIRNLIGGVSRFESAEQLGEQLDAIVSDLAEKRAKAEAAEAARLAEEVSRREAEEAKLKELQEEKAQALAEERERAEKANKARDELLEQAQKDNAALLEAVEKALEANRQQALALHAERRLAGNPQAARIRKILESATLESPEQIDGIIEENSGGPSMPADLDAVRERVRAMSRGGRGYTAREEEAGETGSRRMDEGYNGLGIPLGSLKRMSGIGG